MARDLGSVYCCKAAYTVRRQRLVILQSVGHNVGIFSVYLIGTSSSSACDFQRHKQEMAKAKFVLQYVSTLSFV